jgi:serine/threonine protein kinase
MRSRAGQALVKTRRDMPEETDPPTLETLSPAKKGASVGTGFAGETTGSNLREDATAGGEEATILMGADGVGSQMIGDYEVLGKLGQGGMGAVYRARQISLDRQVALKLLPSTLEADPEFVSRFQREARVAANLNHANLVKVYSSGKADGSHFIAMELVEGETLGQWLKRGALPPPEALRICADVARALEHGWNRAQLIHRDIKPGNIFLSTRGEVKVGDLGLAKSLSGDTTGLTQTGTAMGTPNYISPEQARGDKELDFRADIYSLGCTLYQMLTGQTPYTGSDTVIVLNKHINAPVPAILKVLPSCPIPLARLVGKMLKKSKHERQASYGELLAQIENVLALFAPAASALESTLLHDPDATLLATPHSANPVTATAVSPAKTALKSKLPVYCAIGALILAIALGGVFFLLPRKQKLTKAQIYAKQQQLVEQAASTPVVGSAPRWVDVTNRATKLKTLGSVGTPSMRNAAVRARFNGRGGVHLVLRKQDEVMYRAVLDGQRVDIVRYHKSEKKSEKLGDFDVPPLTESAEHELHFEVRDNEMTVLLDGAKVGTADASALREGSVAYALGDGVTLTKLEYLNLDPPTAAGPPVDSGWIDALNEWWAKPEAGQFLVREGTGARILATKGISLRNGGIIRDVAVRLTVRDVPEFCAIHLRSTRDEKDGSSRNYQATLQRDGATKLFLNTPARGQLSSSPPPTGFAAKKTHTLEFSAQGDRLVVKLDGAEVATAKNRTFLDGQLYVTAAVGAVIEKLEYRRLSAEVEVIPQASLAGSIKATKDAPFVNSLGMKFVPVPSPAGPQAGNGCSSRFGKHACRITKLSPAKPACLAAARL